MRRSLRVLIFLGDSIAGMVKVFIIAELMIHLFKMDGLHAEVVAAASFALSNYIEIKHQKRLVKKCWRNSFGGVN